MADHLAMASHLAGQSMRFSWYFALSRLAGWQAARHGEAPKVKTSRPMPPLRDVLTDLGGLFMHDAAAVRDGIYPATETEAVSLIDHVSRVRQMLADLPRAIGQRERNQAHEARALPAAQGLPDYYTQDFHYQDGGYLTDNSARIYDVQVDLMFLGAANAMRRAALRPIAKWMAGRDQRRISLLDIACGTGRSLRQFRLAYPAMKMTGLDLSQPYLDEARGHLQGLRAMNLINANAEAVPLGDASQDIVTMTFLFHELPPDVRRQVTREVARLLKPGGLFVFIDSIQRGDKPDWDGLLDVFPVRYHEPFFRSYAVEDLDAMFTDAGLAMVHTGTAFLSKVMARRRA